MKIFEVEFKEVSGNKFSEYVYIMTKQDVPNLDCINIDLKKYRFESLSLHAELDVNLFVDNSSSLLENKKEDV